MTQTLLPIPDDILASKTLRPLVERADEWVRDTVTGWSFPVNYEWYRVNSGGAEEMVGFRISDAYSKSHGVFRAADMADSFDFQSRMTPVLTTLLQSSVDERLRRLRLANTTPGGD